MIGMVWKDIYVLKGIALSYLVTLGIFMVMGLMGFFEFSMIGGMMGMVLIMIPISGFTYDEQAGWDQYAASTPAGRAGVVRGKYLFALLVWLGAAVLMGAFYLLVRLVRPGGDDGAGFIEMAMICPLGLVMVELLLPILFKFGAQKARVILMAVIGVVFVLVVGGLLLAARLGIQDATVGWICAALAAVAVVGLAVSYRISLGVYRKKEL